MKNIYVIFGIVIVVVAAFFAFNSFIYNQKQADTSPTEFSSVFAQAMFEKGTEDGLIPIEGFDAGLLLSEFPGLEVEDFEGVKAFEGVYSVENGEVVFTRTGGDAVSSAERTVSEEGYATLLENISARLSFPVYDESDIADVIEILSAGSDIEVHTVTSADVVTRINEGASALGVTVTPREVLDDSRCPTDVQCVWEGTVRVRATLASGLGVAEQEFTLNTPITTEAEEITLTQVSPSPKAGVDIQERDYIFYFSIKER